MQEDQQHSHHIPQPAEAATLLQKFIDALFAEVSKFAKTTVDKFNILPNQLVTATSFQMLLFHQVVDHRFELAGCLGTAGDNAHGIQTS